MGSTELVGKLNLLLDIQRIFKVASFIGVKPSMRTVNLCQFSFGIMFLTQTFFVGFLKIILDSQHFD